MRVRPNDSVNLQITTDKNDLYKKFKIPFDRILNKDFDEFGTYNNEAYVSVDKALENEIVSFFEDSIDEVRPLIGSTGIGKTHLIMHMLKKYYADCEITANNVYIEEVQEGKFDIVLCCAHEKYNKSILSELTRLLYYRVCAINDKLRQMFYIPNVSKMEIEKYIKDLKGEILFYRNEPREFAEQAMILKYILSESGVKFRNFVLIYDDLESLSGDAQHTLICDLFALYECLKNIKVNKHKTLLKFMFCLRETTYSTLSSRADYDTYRAKKRPMVLKKYPSLSDIFEKRFNLCEKNFNLLQEAGNKDTWKKAKEVLLELSQRLDACSKDLLIKLNNYNISDSLDDFMCILTNRKWTQKNRNVRQSFKIREEEYYINNANIFKSLFLGENDVYINNTIYYYPTIFLEGQDRKNDFWCLYLLLFFSKRYNKYIRTGSYNHLSMEEDEVINTVCDLFSVEENKVRNAKRLNRIISKMFEYKFLVKDVIPREKENPSNNLIYISTLGNTIFEEFFKSSVLFSIFRDEMAFDDMIYDIRCTYYLTQEEINEQFYLYIQEFWKIEQEYFSMLITSPTKLDDYKEFFGENIISQKMLKALKDTIAVYFKNENYSSRITKLLNSINELNREINNALEFD